MEEQKDLVKILVKLEEYGDPVAEIPLGNPSSWEKANAILNVDRNTVTPLFLVYQGEGEIELKEIEFIPLS